MSIYVISNDLNIESNLFKVGRTKDSNTVIVSKYQRYLSGARLLLWYPSTITKYVEDEREILRIFDSKRNRTPNGFKNEWLSIPFEELKKIMDEYFGQNGDDFDEEQKRQRENLMFRCNFCDRDLSRSDTLLRHKNTCKKRKQIQSEELIEQKELLERKVTELEKQLTEQKIYFETLLLEQKQLVQTYQQQIFEIAKQPKHQTNNNNNQRIVNVVNQLAPYDLTPELVEQIVEEHFTQEAFEKVRPKICTNPE